ncbi:MAG: TetR/AcrR family transcriptional regulator [Acidimicrobiales bacterium]
MSRQATFDPDELAEAGLAVVSRAGWAGLTMRGVAEELGVTPMALYRLVVDSTALARLVADRVGDGLPVPQGDLVPALGSWARAAHDRLRGLPGLSAYLLANWTELATWLGIVEDFLARAGSEGLEGAEAVGAVNAVFAYTLARAQLRDDPGGMVPRRLAPLRAAPKRYPMIKANLAHFAVARREEAFSYGLEALLDGLAQRQRRLAGDTEVRR